MADQIGKDFYTTQDLRDVIGCGIAAARKLMKDEDFPSIRIGQKYYVSKKEFASWQARKVNEKKAKV